MNDNDDDDDIQEASEATFSQLLSDLSSVIEARLVV